MKRVAALVASALFAGSTALAQIPYRVIDGDTIEVAGSTYRLLGFDTPETFYARCAKEKEMGDKATQRLEALMAAGSWRIEDSGRRDRYFRRLGRLYIGERDAGDIMIEAGLARPYHGKKREGWCSGTP